MSDDAFQDRYPGALAHCYGCGRMNDAGLQVRSRWDGDETVATITPGEQYVATPGYVYGGLVASLIDCHGTGSAAGAMARRLGSEIPDDPRLRFVTASLHVDFLAPTPMGVPLTARGRIEEITDKKVVTAITVTAEGQRVAIGRVVAVRMPATFQGAAG